MNKRIIFFIPLRMYSQVVSIDRRQFYPFDSPPYLTPTSSVSTSVVINWNTKEQKLSFVAFGPDLSLKDTIIINKKTNFHHIIINNLEPRSEYYYKILPDGEIYKFKTFPLFPDSFNFIIIGDTRTDSVSHQAVVDRISHYDFEFIIHTGDLVTKGYNTDDWRAFFNIESKIISQKLFLPTLGNHERPFWQYDSLFALPGYEDFYSVRLGNVAVVCLNTEMDLSGYQRKWLINELKFYSTDTTIHWIFANLHRPPYSSGSHGSDMKVRKAWCPIFEEYGVDIVFSGHDHSYERTKKINGVIYIVSAGGGAPLYNVGKKEWTAHSEKTHHFCLVKIKQKELVLKSIKPDGTVFDSLMIGN
jgi:predicted phosphodiesterase